MASGAYTPHPKSPELGAKSERRNAMSATRKTVMPQRPQYPAPAPADYTDDVSPETLRTIAEQVKDEFNEDDLELIAGPAW